MKHKTYTPPTYLPVRKVEPKAGDHVVMNPALREWLALHQSRNTRNV